MIYAESLVPQGFPTISPGPHSRKNTIRLSGADFMLFRHARRSAAAGAVSAPIWPPARPATEGVALSCQLGIPGGVALVTRLRIEVL